MPALTTQDTRIIETTQASALRLVGLRADDTYGAKVGRVSGILVDRETGAVRWLQLRLSGVRVQHVAVPLDDLTAGAGRLTLPYERAQLVATPRVPAAGALTTRLEHELHDFYGAHAPAEAAPSVWERRALTAKLDEPGRWAPERRGAFRGALTA